MTDTPLNGAAAPNAEPLDTRLTNAQIQFGQALLAAGSTNGKVNIDFANLIGDMATQREWLMMLSEHYCETQGIKVADMYETLIERVQARIKEATEQARRVQIATVAPGRRA